MTSVVDALAAFDASPSNTFLRVALERAIRDRLDVLGIPRLSLGLFPVVEANLIVEGPHTSKMPKWVEQQRCSFETTFSHILGRRFVLADLGDGLTTLEIVRYALYDWTITCPYVHPCTRLQRIANVHAALKVLGSKIKLVGIGASDLVDANLQMRLGFLWVIISEFSVKIPLNSGR
jgi:hypothetical protein